MKKKIILRNLLSILLVVLGTMLTAQENENATIKKEKYSSSNNLRGKNVIMPAGGSSFINGDIDNPKYETFGQIGYKRFLNPHFNLNLNLQKFDLETQDFFDNGFLSFNLNIEYYVLPNRSLSPYIYIGSGLMISNDFTEPNNKLQAGIGLEYLFDKQFGVSLLANGNYVLNENLNQDIFRDVDEFYYGAALGVSFYFGGIKNKGKKVVSNNEPTVISSYPIIND